MGIKGDRATLTKELKMATKEVRHFVYAPGKRPSEGVLLLDKKRIPKSEHMKAKKAAGSAKVYWGACFKEDNKLVFECGASIPETLAKTLRESIKKLTDFVPPKLEARLNPDVAKGQVSSGLPEDFSRNPKARDHQDRLSVDQAEREGGKEPRKTGKGPSDKDLIDVGRLAEKSLKPPGFDTKDSDHAVTEALKATGKDIKDAQKWVEYIAETLKWAEKAGRWADKKDIARAAGQIRSHMNKVSSGLGKAANVVAKAKKITEWVQAMDQFIKATDALEPRDRQSFKHWFGTIERVWDTSWSLYKWSDVVRHASHGAPWAGVAGFATAYYGAVFYVALETLKKGIENTDAYFSRMNAIMAKIAASEKHQHKKLPPKPARPVVDVTDEQHAARQKAIREANKKEKERAAPLRAQLHFDREVFPEVYVKRRPAIAKQILAEIQRGNDDAIDWWRLGFLSGRGELNLPGGGQISAIQPTISVEEARVEIGNLRATDAKCRPLEDFYDKALDAYMKGKTKK